MTAKGVGARLPRKEDRRFLLGEGEYVANIRLANMLDVAFVRSPVAHARIREVRKPAGREGAVFTAQDLEGAGVRAKLLEEALRVRADRLRADVESACDLRLAKAVSEES